MYDRACRTPAGQKGDMRPLEGNSCVRSHCSHSLGSRIIKDLEFRPTCRPPFFLNDLLFGLRIDGGGKTIHSLSVFDRLINRAHHAACGTQSACSKRGSQASLPRSRIHRINKGIRKQIGVASLAYRDPDRELLVQVRRLNP